MTSPKNTTKWIRPEDEFKALIQEGIEAASMDRLILNCISLH
jgi:hypothetical protein